MNTIIRNRRSVYARQFSETQSIPKSAIEQALEAANWAPTHKKTQPWRFQVFTGAAMNRLIDLWVSIAKENTEKKGEEWTEAMETKFTLFRRSSFIMAMACNYSGQVPEVEETCAAAAAIQNFWLSLHEQGFGGFWSTGNGIFTPKIHEYLQLEPNEKALGYFIAGVPEGLIPDSVRKPVSDYTRWLED